MALWHLENNYTSDVVVLVGKRSEQKVLLIRRGHEPFKGYWALPGGFVNSLTPAGQLFKPAETHQQAAVRELREETGLLVSNEALQLLGVFDALGRDPRASEGQRVVTEAFLYQLDRMPNDLIAGDDASELQWFDVEDVLSGELTLAFDHFEMVVMACK